MPRAAVLPLASALLLATTTQAIAQQTPAAKAHAPNAVADVVVTGERAAVVTAIDRKTYNITRDLAGATGSVSDVLRNLPSVEVDVDGNVLLRGESSVQILVDGKPSALLSGAERGLALQQLSASTVQSIEVITNPSAEFSPDGTGGVINIVLRKVTTAGKSGSIQAGAGSQGRWNLNGLGAYKKGPLSLTGSLGVRRQAALQSQTTTTTLVDPILGQRTDALGFNSGEARTGNYSASGQAEYDLTPRDRVSLSASLNRNTSDRVNDSTEVRRNGAGVVVRDFDIAFTGDGYSHVGSLNSTWRRTFAQPGRSLTVTGSHLTNRGVGLQRLVYENRTPAGDRDEHRRTENAFTSTSLTAAYVLPLQKAASLRTGYEYRRSENGQDVTGFLADASGGQTSLPNLTNNFVFVEANHQAYATYQRPVGKLTVLAGVRLEHARTEYDQKTTAIVGARGYVDIHPSLHLQYALTENQNLTASYSHRVARPAGFQLNPFLVISTEFSATSGNPDLRPQETHSLEAGWQWQSGGRSAGATVYYRKNYNVIGTVNRFLTPLIVLNTFENQGTWSSGGLELDTGGRIGERLTYRLNGNVYYTELQRSTFGGGDTRSAYSGSSRGNLDYKATDKDLIQLTGYYNGKRISSQGYSEAAWTANLGYQRKIQPNLIATATISDIFASARFITITDTPALFGRSEIRPAGRTFSFGVMRTFGGRPSRDGQFEYDVAAPG